MTRKKTRRVHPHKFALWVGLTSIIMMFTALTSAYIVRRAADNWFNFELPVLFYVNTGVILLSSVALHLAYKAYVKDKYHLFRILLISGFILGLLFVILQYEAWMQLYDNNITIQINPSGSFLYLITGLHAAHIIGGVAAISVLMVYAFRKKHQEVTPKRKLRIELILTYWHFVDFLWIYLLIFFLLQQ